MRIPLLVHLIFHPASASARALALELHRALNDDAALPGLRVPTAIAPELERELGEDHHETVRQSCWLCEVEQELKLDSGRSHLKTLQAKVGRVDQPVPRLVAVVMKEIELFG